MEPPVFDVIFAGGGTTACVIAGRLASTDPSLKILVIESGQHSCGVPLHVQPYQFAKHLTPYTNTVSFNFGKPSIHLNGRRAVVACGQAIGGGSAVNAMIYVRGAASDYDGWAILGNNGWSFNELLPFIKKLETFTPISGRSTHGYSGPIRISAGGANFGVGKQFLDVAKAYDSDRPQVDDNNDFVTADAYSLAYRFVDPITGRRSDAASSYLYPHAENPNLTIWVRKRVRRVVVEDGRAVGVEYTTDSGDLLTAKAKKLVVVSAGALGSPAILERSGIGARSILEKHGVPVLVDLPGVGENYLDHVGFATVFNASRETETMNEVWDATEAVTEWSKNITRRFGHKWETFFQNNPDKPMGIIAPWAGSLTHLVDGGVSPGQKRLSVTCYILYPEFVGNVHITSGKDVNSPLDLVLDLLSKSSDVAQLTLLYKMSREFIRRMPAYRGEAAGCHPQFPVDSSAACKEADVPVAIDAPDIVYTAAEDEAIEKFLRDVAFSTWHSLGTCAMKQRSQGGVVDARLNVYGVESLKVADLSICPTNVGNNTCSTALLIGEKAAAIIAEDLGYKNI